MGKGRREEEGMGAEKWKGRGGRREGEKEHARRRERDGVSLMYCVNDITSTYCHY